jgi:uncharacterized protein
VVDSLLAEGDKLPLWGAARLGRVEDVKRLLAEGVEADSPGAEGRTALSYAASKGSVPAAQLLIEHGANVNAKSSSGPRSTALHFAASQGRTDVVKLLLAKGASPNVFNGSWDSPLLAAISSRNYETVAALLEGKADPNLRSPDGQGLSVLRLASDDPRMVALLKKYGARLP